MSERRIAMWSGPRNISTAMMRSWEARGDTFVTDEPLYAHYLDQTGLDHPGRNEVLAHHDTDAARVIDWLLGPVPGNKPVWYQKHMAHHILPGMDVSWAGDLTNCLLVREPREMLASLARVLPDPTPEQTGLPQQIELLETLGGGTPVLVARDVLKDPPAMLRALCDTLGVGYTDSMLAWEPGRRETDGIWARHWYASVEASTGFEAYRQRDVEIPAALEPVLENCQRCYERLLANRLLPPSATQ